MQQRADFLVERGLAERRGQRVILIATETGLQHRRADGMRFSLVRWRPVIQQRPGQKIAATVRGSEVSWEIGRQRGLSIG
jgi:hypothetical protein